MCRIYIDFDGVLVDTPKYIKQEIKRNGNLLIDDYNVNIESWKNNGGIGYLFKNNIKLEEILSLYLKEEQV